jgi:outer membrane immunogenic protein
MRTILALSVFIVITSLAATVSAQTSETNPHNGQVRTTEPSDKYGPGGTHESLSEKDGRLLGEVYTDKCGRKREITYSKWSILPLYFFGDKEKTAVTYYYDENGKPAAKVVHNPGGDEYFTPQPGQNFGGKKDKKLDPKEGKALVEKLEKTPSAPCPEGAAGTAGEKKPKEQPQPKIKPETPGGAFSPSLTPPTLEQESAPGGPFNWTGFYAGIEGNYTRSSADFSLMPTGDYNRFPDLIDELRFRGRHEFDGDGGGIGGYGGYNWMLCEHFLFGLEIEGRRVWGLRDHFRTGDFDFGRLGMFDIHSSFDTEDIPYVVTFGPRLGYALGKFLPYLRGGLAFGQVDAHQGIRTSALGGNTFGKESTTQLGWCVGGGLEYALTDHWRLRVEYQYTDLGTLDFMGRGNPDSFRHFTSWNSADVTEHSGNFGLGYSFSQFGKK